MGKRLSRCKLLTRHPGRGIFGLDGPSGSGKTTLLNIIAGIDRATSGEVSIDGTNIAGMSERDLTHWRNQHIGFVFQSFNLIPVLTAFENVELPLLLTNLSKSRRRNRSRRRCAWSDFRTG